MQRRLRTKTVAGVAWLGVGALLVGITACGGVPQSDFDAAKQEIKTQDQKIQALQQQLSASANGASVAQPAGSAASSQAPNGVTTLIGAKLIPTPTAAPPPTAAPAGAQPAAPAAPKTMPDSYRDPVGPFTFYVETLATTSIGQSGWGSTIACTPNSVFKRGMKIVWRFEIYDIATGKRVTGEDSPTVTVKLSSGEEATARFSQRGGGQIPDAPWTWGANWEIPMSYPLGSIGYTIEVKAKDGRTSTFTPPSVIGTGEDSRLKVVA